jgi:hypothetical protein
MQQDLAKIANTELLHCAKTQVKDIYLTMQEAVR